MAAVDVVLTDARIHLPEGDIVEGWVAVAGESIDAIGEGCPPRAAEYVDCLGRWVLPSLVDIHVHFRDPGFTYKEDFSTGSAAAAAGGVTVVVDMPNTESSVITANDFARKLSRVRGRSFVDYGLYALLVSSDEHLPELLDLGVAGLKWMFGQEPAGPSGAEGSKAGLRDALSAAADSGMLVGVHAEDPAWVSELRARLESQGRKDAAAHGESRPPFTEALAVAQAAILAADVGCSIHIHHLSSQQGLAMVDAMRQTTHGTITAEVCPHHLFLTQRDLKRLGTKGKVNPPLRDEDDVGALWSGVLNGSIDCIASDHAPHAPAEKVPDDVWSSESGVIGVETTFPMLFHEVMHERLSIHRFIEITSETPAKLVGLGDRKGKILPGYDADLVIVDPETVTSISSSSLHSKYQESPFDGLERSGRISSVYLRGNQIVADGILQPTPQGRHAPSRLATASKGP